MTLSSTLDEAFSDAMMDLDMMWKLDVEAGSMWSYKREVGYAVGELCDALEKPSEHDIPELARFAYRVVSRLADFLEEVDSDDRCTRDKLDLTRETVAELRDAIAPLKRAR